jgi:hypothetical protein
MFHHTKRLILIVVGIAALAGGPTAVIASAQSNDGGSFSYDCAGGKAWFDQRVADYNNLKGTNPKAAEDARNDAKNEKARATAGGCDTSNWIVPFVITSSGPYHPASSGYVAPPSPAAAERPLAR